MTKKPFVIERKKTAGGKWLELEILSYCDHSGRTRSWECATRVNSRGAVMMIVQLRPSGKLVFIRQFRPPADNYVIEFPAGLIDDGESPGTTAIRELYEETGLHGSVDQVISPALNSPGLSGESITTVMITVDETLPENINPIPQFEDSESIETFLIEPGTLPAFISNAEAKGDRIDAKIIAFITGMNLQTSGD
jgi:ADP-ribose diphosphatase